MKQVKSFTDIEFIIKHKLDLRDNQNNKLDFVRFLGMTLIEVIGIINSGNYRYDINF